jgi:hypothetical protein
MSIGNPFGDHEGYLKTINNTDNKGMFITAIFDDPKTFMTGYDFKNRCDYNSRKAAHGFHKFANGICNCGLAVEPNNLTGNHFSLEDISALFNVVDAYPAGAILYIELNNDEDFYLTQRGNTLTRTLQEQLRFLIEWKYAHEHLDNNEQIAVTATEIINLLAIPQSIQNWILSDVPNEKVNRFLEGRTDALQRTQEAIPDLTEEFKEWLLNQFKQAKNFGEHE